MDPVNMLEAKSNLSRLVEAVESGREPEIVIARNGRPVARLVAFERTTPRMRLGLARGQFEVPDDIGGADAEIAALFGAGRS